MKDLINKIQKDISKLQATLEKEGDEILRRVKRAADDAKKNKNIAQIEKQIESRIKKLEPALEKFYQEIKANAGKYGIDLSGLESTVRSTAKAARRKITGKVPAKKATKKTTKKTAKKVVKKTTAAKKPAANKPAKKLSKKKQP